MSDFKNSDSFKKLENNKKRLYSQMQFLNSNLGNDDFTEYTDNNKSFNDFKIQKNDYTIKNDKIINEMNTTEQNNLNGWYKGRKPQTFNQYLNN